jgi:Geminivirus Rep catalytic domain
MPAKKNNQRAICTTYILLTYAQTKDDFDFNAIHRIVSNAGGTCVIAREKHKDGGTHYHAFLHFNKKRFQTRSFHYFDTQGHHPNIAVIRYTPWKSYDYTIKDGDVVFNNCERPTEQGNSTKRPRLHMEWQTVMSSQTEHEFLQNMRDLLPGYLITNYNNICSYMNDHYRPEEVPVYEGPTFDLKPEAPETLQAWIEGFKAGLEHKADENGFDGILTAKERLAFHAMITINA